MFNPSPVLSPEQVLEKLRQHADPQVVQGQSRFGSRPAHPLGIKIPVLRTIAKEIGCNHALALELWASGIHEARILAAMVDEPQYVSREQMEAWVRDFDTWDVCDQVCGGLFDKTPYAYQKAIEWCHREEEFVRRAGFVLTAYLAVHDKRASDKMFSPFFPLIKQYATDERNFVKKAVNWALRQIGKRNAQLLTQAIACGEEIQQVNSRAARWIASDALRELRKIAIASSGVESNSDEVARWRFQSLRCSPLSPMSGSDG